jgi:hypothetical protein|tara:strand:+ start:1244 stop:1450 length:207 start_codon:yes stop_codon:yes gene_type:complete
MKGYGTDEMRRGEKSLAVRAKQHISICCKTLCEREIVEEYIQQLEDKVEMLEYKLELKEKVLDNVPKQ